MQDRKYDYVGWFRNIENYIRESRKDCTAYVFVDNL